MESAILKVRQEKQGQHSFISSLAPCSRTASWTDKMEVIVTIEFSDY